MKIGEIYVWDSDQALGHAIRRKFHVYIGEAGWRADGHALLFISSANYGADYKICAADYPFLARDSFVSCSAIVTYSENQLTVAKPQLVAALTAPHLAELFAAIRDSSTMVGWQINLCCDFLKRFVS